MSSYRNSGRSLLARWTILGATLVLFSCLLWWTGPVQELNHRVSDSWFQLRTQKTTSPDVALVLIDDGSLQRYGRWPWSRTELAELVKRISLAHPRVLGFDVLVPEPESDSADEALATAFRSAGNVVLVDKISGSSEGQLWIEPLPKFAEAAASVGHAQAMLDADGVCRRFPLAELSLDGPRMAFATEVAKIADASAASAFLRFHEGVADQPLVRQSGGTESVVPITATIGFRAATRGENPGFVTLSATDVLEGDRTDALRDKVVMVGFGSSDIHDRLVTPVSGALPTPGVEIHAHIVDSILSRRFVAPMPLSLQFVLLVCICFGSAAVGLRFGTWKMVGTAIVLCAAIYGLGFTVFAAFGRQADAGTLVLSALLAVPTVQIEKLVRAERLVNRQLRQLRGRLPLEAASVSTSGDVNWKLKTLESLQAQLAAAYEFEHTLLETSHDRIAVFSEAGKLLFCNSAFRQLWSSSQPGQDANLEAFKQWVGTSGTHVDITHLPVMTECHLDDHLWNLRLTEVPSEPGGTRSVMLVMTDLQARMERDRTRTEALAFVTHELRTPLMSIQGFAEMMTRSPEKVSDAAPEIIFRESRRLVALINSYLDVLRLDSGARPLKIVSADAHAIAQHVVRVLEPIAGANGILLTVSPSEDAAVVECDEALVAGALMNLASNAIKYGGEGCQVRISTTVREDSLVFSVWNNGPSIAPADMERLFDPFYRGAGENSRCAGWGLGLAFVKRMVDRHNGSVTVESDNARGTEFRILLPGSVRLAATRVGAS